MITESIEEDVLAILKDFKSEINTAFPLVFLQILLEYELWLESFPQIPSLHGGDHISICMRSSLQKNNKKNMQS